MHALDAPAAKMAFGEALSYPAGREHLLRMAEVLRRGRRRIVEGTYPDADALVTAWGAQHRSAEAFYVDLLMCDVVTAAGPSIPNLAAFEKWSRFGTNVDKRDQPLAPRSPGPVEHLSAAEAELYHALISPDWATFRRIEQERIPRSVAHELVLSMLTTLAR